MPRRAPTTPTAIAVMALLAAAPGPARTAPPRVTVFGDSVQASFLFAPQAVALLRPGLDLRMQAAVCRKLSTPGCLGGRPESVLTVATALGSSLGDAVVVNVGYNDFAAAYDAAAVMRTFVRAHVKAVVWVTLRERHGHYATTNALIRDTARRAAGRPGHPVVRVADWNATSVGRPWFVSDGVHLNAAGAVGLAGLLRTSVVGALADAGIPVLGPPLAMTPDRFPLRAAATTLIGDGDTVWVEGGGRMRPYGAATGRPLQPARRLGPSESLVSDGYQAWVTDARGTAVTRAARRSHGPGPARAAGVDPLLARAGGHLWMLSACGTDDTACTGGGVLQQVTARTGADTVRAPLERPAQAAAASPTRLWVVTATPGTPGATLELHSADSGRLIRSTPLPGGRPPRALRAGDAGAWVLLRSGQVLLVRPDGTRRVMARRAAAIAAADDQVWVLSDDRRTLRNLHPHSGRVRAVAHSTRPLRATLTLTSDHVWGLARAGRELVRVHRR